MTPAEQLLHELYSSVVRVSHEVIAEGDTIPPALYGVRQTDAGPEVLSYTDLLDARQHLYAMRAAYHRDGLTGLVFAAMGQATFEDAAVPALMTVRATPDEVLAEMREVSALRDPFSQPQALRAPREAEAAYEDVFTDVPLPTIRAGGPRPGKVVQLPIRAGGNPHFRQKH